MKIRIALEIIVFILLVFLVLVIEPPECVEHQTVDGRPVCVEWN